MASAIHQPDFSVDDMVMSMCRVFSCVFGRGCLLWPICSLSRTLLAFSLLHSVLPGQIFLLFQVFLDFWLFIPVPWNEKDIFFWVLALEGLVGLHRAIQLQLLQCYWLGLNLDYCHIEWFPLEMNRDHSVVFEIASKYCISDFFVDCDGYCISYKGFLPTVLDIMVTWVKFTHSSPFSFADSFTEPWAEGKLLPMPQDPS